MLTRPANWPAGLRDPIPQDWVEDAADENGCYNHTCISCGTLFIAHKRRPNLCKVCHTVGIVELKRRADWLFEHNAPKDWVVLTTEEFQQLKSELVRLTFELHESRR